MRTRRTWLVLLAALTIVAAACGGDGDEDGGEDAGGVEETGGAAPATGTTGPAEELGGTLTISNWDAYMPEDLIPTFEEQTGTVEDISLTYT